VPSEPALVVNPVNHDRGSESRTFSIDQATVFLGVSRSTLQRMRNAGEIAFATVGTGTRRPRVRFTEKHLTDFLLRSETPASALPASRRGVNAKRPR
jgi:excisionase family DNA binding protein